MVNDNNEPVDGTTVPQEPRLTHDSDEDTPTIPQEPRTTQPVEEAPIDPGNASGTVVANDDDDGDE